MPRTEYPPSAEEVAEWERSFTETDGYELGSAIPESMESVESQAIDRLSTAQQGTPATVNWRPMSYWKNKYSWGMSNMMGEDLLILNSWDIKETECEHVECGWYCKEKRI